MAYKAASMVGNRWSERIPSMKTAISAKIQLNELACKAVVTVYSCGKALVAMVFQ